MNEKNISKQLYKTVGVDVGGTKIIAGLVENGKILKSKTLPTPVYAEKDDIVKAIVDAIRLVLDDDCTGIGIGVPGLINTKEGIVHNVGNIPDFSNVPLKQILEKELGKTVFVNNNANCFALGAKNFDNAKQFNNLVGLTLGTGLGGGIIIKGHLYEGVGCGAGEFGYLPYYDGILEHYCSGQFFKRQFHISGKDAATLALSGDESALHMFNRFGFHLGDAIKIVAHFFAPEAIMLGGSISKNFKLFEKSMWSSIHLFPYSHVVDNLVVKPASNPEIAVVGAASLVSE